MSERRGRPSGMAFLMQHRKLKRVPPHVASNTNYTADQVYEHRTEDDCWVTYRGRVYDITQYLDWHPAGKDIMRPFFGYDITEACNVAHSWVGIHKMLEPLHIGMLQGPPRLLRDYDYDSLKTREFREGPPA